MVDNTSRVWEIQKSIFRQMKKRALELEEDGYSQELKQYRASQKRFAKRSYTLSSLEELITSLKKATVIYLGDFHSFDQQSKNYIRILKLLNDKKSDFFLGVEFIHEKYQPVINSFLVDQITEGEFLEGVHYNDTWRFPWAHYKHFFEIAKKNKLDVYALNSTGSLSERDTRAAKIIAKQVKLNPSKQALILFGELHIIPNKLPKKVSSLCKQIKDYRHCIIHQNLDDVYWSLHQENIENNNRIVQFNKNEYSLQTSPPWIKYESMIYWYENLSLNPGYEIEDHFEALPPPEDLLENLLFYSRKASDIYEIEVQEESLEDINFYDHHDLEFVIEEINKLSSRILKQFYHKLITEGASFFIPNTNRYYCSSYSVNRISHLAGLHLYNLNTKNKKGSVNIDRKSFFIKHLHQQTLGHLTSKIINPFLKCDLYLDLKKTSHNPINRIALSMIEDRRINSYIKHLKKETLITIYLVARTLGRYCGEMLYEEILPRQPEIFRKQCRYLLSQNHDLETCLTNLKLIIPDKSYQTQKKPLF